MVPSLTVILPFCHCGLMGKTLAGIMTLPSKALQLPSGADEIASRAGSQRSALLPPGADATDFFILSRMPFMCSQQHLQ